MTYPAFMQNPERGCAPRKQVDPNIFFASPRQDAQPHEKSAAANLRVKAKKICARACPFTRECFTWAASRDEKHGVWGAVDMADSRDVARARRHYGLTAASEPEPVAETDDAMAERVLSAGPAAYRQLTDQQRATVIREGLRRGFGLNVLSHQFRTTTRAMRALVGADADRFDQQVHELYRAGKSDPAIALSLDCDTKLVARARGRMGLPPLFGPGGRPRKNTQTVAA